MGIGLFANIVGVYLQTDKVVWHSTAVPWIELRFNDIPEIMKISFVVKISNISKAIPSALNLQRKIFVRSRLGESTLIWGT